jgi:hypothetical protein
MGSSGDPHAPLTCGQLCRRRTRSQLRTRPRDIRPRHLRAGRPALVEVRSNIRWSFAIGRHDVQATMRHHGRAVRELTRNGVVSRHDTYAFRTSRAVHDFAPGGAIDFFFRLRASAIALNESVGSFSTIRRIRFRHPSSMLLQ